MEEYSLKEIFDSERAKIEELKKEIEKTDKEIDKMVYEIIWIDRRRDSDNRRVNLPSP